MVKETRNNNNADPPGLDPPTLDGDEEAEDESSARIQACEEELESRRKAIEVLRDVVMKQRATIQSLKAEQSGKGQISRSPLGNVREQLVSKNSATSRSSDTSGSVSFQEDNLMTSPAIRFEQIRESQEESEDVMSEITCDDESSIDSSNFLQMKYEMQAMIESLKEQALSPMEASPLDAMVSFEMLKPPLQQPVARDGINGAIESIQEQALHVDAAIALDQLQTTKNELLVVTNELQNRTTEVRELSNQLKVLQCQIATLELERDLHMAEASRARDDLKECIQYIVKMRTEGKDDDSRRGSVISHHTSSMSQATSVVSGGFATPKKTSSSVMSIQTSYSGPNVGERPSSAKRATPSTQVSENTHQSVLFPDEHSMSSFSSDGHPRRNLALCFWTQRGKEVVDGGPAFERMDDNVEPKRVSLFRRRSRKKEKKKSSSTPADVRLTSSQRAQQAMPQNQSLADAEREADALRTRLHSVTRYYDNVVVSLQQNTGSNNAEYEADMINQLSFLDREKRAIMTELREKDAMIATHQKAIKQLMCITRPSNQAKKGRDRALFV